MMVLGCVAAFILLLVVWFCIPYSPLKAEFEKDSKELSAASALYQNGEVFDAADFANLPTAIQKLVEKSGYIGKKKMNRLTMEYRDVAFSQGKNGPNLKIDYIQHDFVKSPNRLAMIKSSLFGIPFQGYDYYRDGKGGMKGVIAKVFMLFDQTGAEMDRACLATFLAESMFAPTILLQDYIQLEEINDHQVKATISAYGQTVSGIFNFNDEYEMTSFTTKDRAVVAPDGSIEYVPWSAVCGEYKVSDDGLKLPTKFQAVWNYKDGDFVYFDGKISRIAYE
jgi:hypothetical protein